MTISYTTATRNARLDSVTTTAGNAALLRFYDNTGGVPANANAAIGSCVLLAELTCGSPLASAASAGVLTLNSVTQDSSANATGTAAFWRLYKSDGTTVVMQGSVGTSGADLNLSTLSIVSTVPVQLTSLTITAGNP